jgi:hypothetical protein
MSEKAPRLDRQDMRNLRHELLKANDRKIGQVVAMLDALGNPAQAQAMLDPLRPRVAALRPARPLRFVRMLFLPLNPLIVPASTWRVGDATVPRSVLLPIANVVESGVGDAATASRALIAGQKTDAVEAVAKAGGILWPLAAQILTASPAPAEWHTTGLRLDAFAPMARALAAVFRRAERLRRLARDAEIGAVDCDETQLSDILSGLEDEAPEGCAMVVRLILGQAPHAAPLLRRIVAACRDVVQRRRLQRAVAVGVDQVLTGLEHKDEVTVAIRHGTLGNAGVEVRRIAALLSEVESDTGSVQNRPRLKAIRAKLDEVCRAKLEDGMQEGWRSRSRRPPRRWTSPRNWRSRAVPATCECWRARRGGSAIRRATTRCCGRRPMWCRRPAL